MKNTSLKPTITRIVAMAFVMSGNFAHAQTHDHSVHGDHSAMHSDMASPQSTVAPETGHDQHDRQVPQAAHGSHNSHEQSEMDMRMQGGAAPPEARDPNAYSGGYALHSGPYLYTPNDGHAMHLGDETVFATVLAERLERAYGSDGNATAYDVQAWLGTSYDKLTLKAEGSVNAGNVEDARTELLWSHAIATFWDVQTGLRNDTGHDRPTRNWLALGIQGLAPYWFEVEATAYMSSSGRSALRLSASYELLLTQRLILQPRLEANLYGKRDTELMIGSGLSNGSAGLRLRYELSREFAPYLGVERMQYFGRSADMVEAAGGHRGDTRWVAGVRLWF